MQHRIKYTARERAKSSMTLTLITFSCWCWTIFASEATTTTENVTDQDKRACWPSNIFFATNLSLSKIKPVFHFSALKSSSGVSIMPSITDDAAAFMKEIGLVSTTSSGKSKKGSKPSQKKGGVLSSETTTAAGKSSARKWGKETKEKKAVAVAAKYQVPVSTLSKSQLKEVAWLKDHTPSTQPLITLTEEEKWYDLSSSFDTVDPTAHRTSKENIKTIVAFAEQTFHAEVALHHKLKSSSGFSQDQKWVDEVLKSGTLSDKVAALALQVQQSPPHELEALDSLITLALKKEQRTSQLALEALKDLLIHNLLPDRRLKAIMQQPLGHAELTPQAVTLMWYEVELMKRTERIIEAIEAGLKSTVDYFKRFCMEVVYDWIVAKPEQEGRLLSLLVNKLGDPTNKICSKCVELLGKLVCRHTAMKGVVVREVRQLISRSNLPPRAVYSGIIFLSQIALSAQEAEVSSQLVQCYVSLFEKAVTQDKLGSKLLVALLIGINRAYPFLKDKETIIQHIDALFRIVHSASFSTSTQALTLISHIVLNSEEGNSGTSKSKGKGKEKEKVEEAAAAAAESSAAPSSKAEVDLVNRFYRALYSQLLADQILTRSHNTLFLNLLFRSMKRDPVDTRVIAFVKRILICATQSTAPIAAGLIFLVSEVFHAKPALLESMLEIESNGSPAPLHADSPLPDSSYWLLGNFDASKRDALHACPRMPSIWETTLFSSHYHPSVQAFSSAFLDPAQSHTIKYNGDPTSDFSLSSFLNRFAYKNPKKTQFEMRRKRSQAAQEEPMNSKVFQDMEAADIAPEKEFFHKYFYDRSRMRDEGKSRNRSRHKEKTGEDEDEDESDFDEDGEMDKFADKLALDLMASAGNGPVDIDDDDDFMDSDDSGDDSGDGKEDEDDEYDIMKGADMDGMGSGDDSYGEFTDEDGEENVDFGSESDEEPVPSKKSNKRKKGGSEFASAEDYEEEMEAIVVQQAQKKAVSKDVEESDKPAKKSKKSKKR
jgi:ribosome biogenesis protein MAK21